MECTVTCEVVTNLEPCLAKVANHVHMYDVHLYELHGNLLNTYYRVNKTKELRSRKPDCVK